MGALVKRIFSHPLFKGSAIVFAGTMAANVGAYLYHLVVGRILGPAQYGELAALLSLSYMLSVFSVMLQTVVTRFVAQENAKQNYGNIKSFILKLIALLIMAGVICLLVLIGFAPIISRYLHIKETIVIYILFTGVVISMIGVVLASVLQGLQKFMTGTILTNINSALRLVAGFFAAGFGVTATLAAGLGASIVTTIIAFFPLRSIFMKKINSESVPLTPMISTSFITFLSVLGISVLNSQDVVLVKHFMPGITSGWYSALSTMGKIIFFASSSIMYVLLPIVSERAALGKRSKGIIFVSVGIVAGLSAMITAGFFVLPHLALQLLYGEAFLAAAPYVGIFGIFSSLYTVAYTIVTALLGLGNTKVWILLIAAAIAQNILITLFHSSIYSVIWVNISLSLILVVSLFFFTRKSS